MIAERMIVHLENMGVESSANKKAFVEDYFRMMGEVALEPVRVLLPLNLGYIQSLQHDYSGKDKEHLKTFGRMDYSVIWMKHPMFRFHKITTDKNLDEAAREKKLKGGKFLKDYFRGDYFI